jgi:hypothetical protein
MVRTQNYKQTEPQSLKARRLTAGLIILLVCVAWAGVILGGWFYYDNKYNYFTSVFVPGAKIPICSTPSCAIDTFLKYADDGNGMIEERLVYISKDSLNKIFAHDVQFDVSILLSYPMSFIPVTEENYVLFQYNRIKVEMEKEEINYNEKDYNGLSLIEYQKDYKDRSKKAVYLFDFSSNIFVDCANYSNQVNRHCGFNAALCQYNIRIKSYVFPDNIDRYFEFKKFLEDFSAQLHTALIAKYGPKKGKCYVQG